MPQTPELDLERPLKFLERERMAQRIGVGVLTLFVLAGAAGAFGNGPLSRASAEGATHLTYERFGRTTAATSVVISVETSAADGVPVRFRLDRTFLDGVDELEVRPADALKGLDEGSVFFEVPAAGGQGHVELRYKPGRPGVFHTLVSPENGRPSRVWQLIYF